MNLWKRACLYTLRKWKHTLLVLGLLTGTVTLVFLGLAAQEAQEEQTAELRGATGASFQVRRNLSSGGFESSESGMISTQDYVSEEMVERIAAVDGIAGYDASFGTIPDLFDASGKNLNEDELGFFAYGSYHSEYNSLFVSGRFVLTEGSHITPEMKDGIVLSRDCVERNGLKLGDTITANIWDPNVDNHDVKLKLVGVFDIAFDKDDAFNAYDTSTYFDYEEYAFCSNAVCQDLASDYGEGDDGFEDAFFYVEDASELDQVVEAVKALDGIDWNHFTLTKNDEVYQNIAGALGDTGALITVLIVLMVVVSLALMMLVQSLSVRSRQRELGILMTCGIGKKAIFLQLVAEMALVAVVAFLLAFCLSRGIWKLAGQNAQWMVTTETFMILMALGGGLLTLIVFVSSWSVLRQPLKQIFARME